MKLSNRSRGQQNRRAKESFAELVVDFHLCQLHYHFDTLSLIAILYLIYLFNN